MAGFHIQVLATSDRDKAEALVARLVDADFKAFIVPSNEGGRTVYRVRVGPFDDRAIAAGKAEELESRWGLEAGSRPGLPEHGARRAAQHAEHSRERAWLDLAVAVAGGALWAACFGQTERVCCRGSRWRRCSGCSAARARRCSAWSTAR